MYRCFVLMETVNHSYSVPAFSFTQTNAADFFLTPHDLDFANV